MASLPCFQSRSSEETVNPYEAPQADPLQAHSIDAAGIGLRWGCLFAIPFAALFLFTLCTGPLSFSIPLLPLPLTVVLAGRWWGRKGLQLATRDLLGAAAIQGFAGGLLAGGLFAGMHWQLLFVNPVSELLGATVFLSVLTTILCLLEGLGIRKSLGRRMSELARNTEQA